jgi:hypothetical protein
MRSGLRDALCAECGWWFEKREDAYTFIKRYGGYTS